MSGRYKRNRQVAGGRELRCPDAARSRLARSTDDRLVTREPHNRIERPPIMSIRDFPLMFCMIILLYYHCVHKCGRGTGRSLRRIQEISGVPDRALSCPVPAAPGKNFFAAQ